jgi:NADH-quinone oxidoreductase subunit J
MFINILYFLFTLVVGGSIMILFTKHELFALPILILVIIGLSAVYFLQDAPFVAIIQLILHAGGILILIVCSLLFLKPLGTPSNNRIKHMYKKIAIGITAIFLMLFTGYKLKPLMQQFDFPSSHMPVGTLQKLGYQILGPYGLVLELVSILLLLSLVSILHIINQGPKAKHE